MFGSRSNGGSFASPEEPMASRRFYQGTGYLDSSLPSAANRGSQPSIAAELREIIGGDVTIQEIQRHFGGLSKEELAAILTTGGLPKMRSIILEGRQKEAAAKPSSSDSKMRDVAGSIVEALVGNQLGPTGSGLVNEMISKVQSLLAKNFEAGDGKLLSGLMASGGDKAAMVRLLDAAKAGQTDGAGKTEEDTSGQVVLGIERGGGGRMAAFGWAWTNHADWNGTKVANGSLNDEELLVEACAEFVMDMVTKASMITTAGLSVVKVSLMATPAEILRVQGLTEGEWGNFVKRQMGGKPFPIISWLAVGRSETEAGVVLARKALTEQAQAGQPSGAPKALFPAYGTPGGGTKEKEAPMEKAVAKPLNASKPDPKANVYDPKFKDFTCRKCRNMGHIAKDCKEPKADLLAMARPLMGRPQRTTLSSGTNYMDLMKAPLPGTDSCILCEGADHPSAECPRIFSTKKNLQALQQELLITKQMEEEVSLLEAQRQALEDLMGGGMRGGFNGGDSFNGGMGGFDGPMGFNGGDMGYGMGGGYNGGSMNTGFNGGSMNRSSNGRGGGFPNDGMWDAPIRQMSRGDRIKSDFATSGKQKYFPDITCRRCEKVGHYARDCHLPPQGNFGNKSGPRRGGNQEEPKRAKKAY